MPGVDDYDQNIPTPLLTDPPNIESAVGNSVAAMVPHLNMTFADANARSAAIPTPVAGMEVFLIAEARKELWDGSTWVSLTPGPWIPITPASGFEVRSGSPAYRIVNKNVELRGTIQRNGAVAFVKGAPFTLLTLPTEARPTAYRTFIAATTWAADMYARAEVASDGPVTVIVPNSTTTGASWISLDNIRYSLV
ncbi:hypothetical protein ACFQ8W_00430 [Streptomyces sp. NPDC056508]|uniref:hypothetical protein n=1 Tax=Streptomyces sp. NPDC056508 TaxID=3345845 RepID=UPI0036C7E2D0